MGRELPSASFSATHRWSLARANEPLGTPFLWEADMGLGGCGDWMHGACIEDAFTSGELLALTILREKTLPAIHA
jgi:renalase